MHDMSNDSQLEQFQREFRENVNNKLDYLTNKIDNMPALFANAIQFDTLKEEVENLKSFKNKAIGGILAFQVVLTIVGYLVAHSK